MRVFGLWYGGNGYAAPRMDSHLEEFASIAHAKREFEKRAYGIGKQETFYVSLPNEDVYFPSVDIEESNMWLFKRDPRGEHDPYPDVLLTFGPRGGVQASPC